MLQRPQDIPQFRRWIVERLNALAKGADCAETLKQCKAISLQLGLPDVAAMVNGDDAIGTLSRCLSAVDLIRRPTTIPQYRRWLIERLHVLSHVEGAGEEPLVDPAQTLVECRKFALRLGLADVAALVNGDTSLKNTVETISRCLAAIKNTSNCAITVQQAADRLQLSTKTVYKLCADGVLPHKRVGRTIKIEPADLDSFVQTFENRSGRSVADLEKCFR